MHYVDPLGLKGTFRDNFSYSYEANKRFFFTGPTQLIRTGIGLFTVGSVAENTGLYTAGQAIAEFFNNQKRYAPELGMAGWATAMRLLTSVGLNSIANTAVVGTGVLAGIVAGSAIESYYRMLWFDVRLG